MRFLLGPEGMAVGRPWLTAANPARQTPRVVAAILTHNRADQAVERCEEVLAQTRPVDAMIVVDNGSTDDTAARIAARFPHARLIRLRDNLGPAGGYAAAFADALTRPFDYLWAIDDDVVLARGCLEDLLVDAARVPGAVIFPERLPRGRAHGVGWHGVLIPAEVVQAVGVPRADLFWWIEDTEYFIYRVRDLAGFRLYFSARAQVHHNAYRPRRGYPGWKLYYETRNTMYYRFHLRRGFLKRARSVLRFVARAMLVFMREERGPAKAWMMIRGFRDGVLGSLGKTVDPASEAPRNSAKRQVRT